MVSLPLAQVCAALIALPGDGVPDAFERRRTLGVP